MGRPAAPRREPLADRPGGIQVVLDVRHAHQVVAAPHAGDDRRKSAGLQDPGQAGPDHDVVVGDDHAVGLQGGDRLDRVADADAPGALDLDGGLIDETLGVVLKYEEDVRHVKGATTRQYLAETAAGTPRP